MAYNDYSATTDDQLRRKMEEDLMAIQSPNLADPSASQSSESGPSLALPSGPQTGGTPTTSAPAVAGPAPVAMPTNPMATPPPPPPPPAPGMGGGLNLEGYAQDWMSEPNRFLSPFVESVREAGDMRRAQQAQEAGAGIDEWISSRGLVGSSYEGDARVDLQQKLAANAAAEERDLLKMIADVEARDRLAAGEYGLDVAEFGQRDDQFAQSLQHQLNLQQNELSQREAEFARGFGLDERQFMEQQNQFAQQFSEQVASRLQQNEQFRQTLESEDARFAIDSGLRSRALDLQAEGMSMDDAFRRAALEQERDLTLSAQELEERGLELEDAYRYAALSQDGEFRTRALDLQEQGMGLDEAFRQAELEFRQKDAERRARTTQAAILVQALQAIGNIGGLGMDPEQLVSLILGNNMSLGETGSGGNTTGGTTVGGVTGDSGSDMDSRDVTGSGTEGWGPNGDMTYDQWVEYLLNNDEE